MVLEMARVKGKRILITLPDGVADEIEAIANNQGRSLAGLCAFLAEMGLIEYKKTISTSDK